MNYAHPETLVETQWLAEHLDDPQLRIIQMDMNSEAYDKEHIPGSILWSTFTLIRPDLKYLLGCDRVKNYDGSWNEWSRLANAPIAR